MCSHIETYLYFSSSVLKVKLIPYGITWGDVPYAHWRPPVPVEVYWQSVDLLQASIYMPVITQLPSCWNNWNWYSTINVQGWSAELRLNGKLIHIRHLVTAFLTTFDHGICQGRHRLDICSSWLGRLCTDSPAIYFSWNWLWSIESPDMTLLTAGFGMCRPTMRRLSEDVSNRTTRNLLWLSRTWSVLRKIRSYNIYSHIKKAWETFEGYLVTFSRDLE